MNKNDSRKVFYDAVHDSFDDDECDATLRSVFDNDTKI